MSDETKLAALRKAHAEDVRDLIYNNECMEEEIERLEAELAEMRSERDLRISIEAELRDELADLRASSAVVRVRCDGRCSPETGAMHHAESCDGWQLAEGVRRVKFPYEAETTPTFYVIPARLIEGEA